MLNQVFSGEAKNFLGGASPPGYGPGGIAYLLCKCKHSCMLMFRVSIYTAYSRLWY